MTVDLRVIVRLCSLALLLATDTAAAEDPAENTGVAPRTLEVGLITSVIPPLPALGFGVRVAIVGEGPVAFEMEAEWLDAGRHLYLSDQIVWHYVLQGVHELRAGGQGRAKVFATYGASGWSVRNATRTGFHNSLMPPFMPTGGVGLQWPIASRATLRTDFQVIVILAEGATMTPRLTVGASLPIRLGRRSSS